MTLGDLFEVRRGLATGANSFFIMTREDARNLGLPTEYLKPVLPSPRHLKTGIVTSDSDGHPMLDSQLVLLDCDLPEDDIRERFLRLHEYLATGIADGVRDRYLPSNRSLWYRQEQRLPAPYLSNYMGRGSGEDKPFRFIWNQSQAVATNVYLMLYPKPPLLPLLDDPKSAALVHQALNSLDADELRFEGRVYGGGLHKIEPKELLRMSAAPLIDAIPELASVSEFAPAENGSTEQFDLWGG